MISTRIGHRFDPAIVKVCALLFGKRTPSPNTLTLIGLAFSCGAAFAVAFDRLVAGGILLAISGFFDVADGAVARTVGQETPFGGFLDSVLDRYSDLVLLFGIFVHFLTQGDHYYSIVAFVTAIGTAIVPYARARAEGAGFQCRAGLLERPERMVLMLLGLLFPVLPYVMIVLAVLSHVTVIQRILYVRNQAKE